MINQKIINGRPVSGITVNGKNSGNIISRTGDLKATVKFFFWADENQMPVKQVCVDFDNGAKSSGCYNDQNFFKNHRGWKNKGAGGSNCDETDFGKTKRACTEDYFSASTTYTCTRNVGPNWNPTCPDPTVSGGCCVFVPKVQVKDNLGWCNGSCPGEPGGDGCYDAFWDGRDNECETTRALPAGVQGPWTPFAGKVIVVPR